MKFKTVVILGIVTLIVILLANGIFRRPSTETEARDWANSYLQDQTYSSTYTTPETLYNEQGNPVVVDVPAGEFGVIRWTGALYEQNDEWGEKWCFKMQRISQSGTFPSGDKCVNLARNALTGGLLSK
jgi:hypothetical protein